MTPAPATPPLDRERIALTALELVDREGLGVLSMRRLATELGVGTMTLYGYVDGKEALLDAMLDAATGEPPDLPAELGWREELRLLATHARGLMARHPSVARLRVERPLLRPGQLRLTERGLRTLQDAGLPPDEAAHAFRLLFTFVLGSVAFAAHDGPQARAALAGLDPAAFPTVRGSADALIATMDDAATFAYGLDLILDGLAARLGSG